MESLFNNTWQQPQNGFRDTPPKVEIISPAGAWPRSPIWRSPPAREETARQFSGGTQRRSSDSSAEYVSSPPISPACVYRQSPGLEGYGSPVSPPGEVNFQGGYSQDYRANTFYSPSKAIPIISPNSRQIRSPTSPISPNLPPAAFSPVYGQAPPKHAFNWAGVHVEGAYNSQYDWGEGQMATQNRSRGEQTVSPHVYYSPPMMSPQRVPEQPYLSGGTSQGGEGGAFSPSSMTRGNTASPKHVVVVKGNGPELTKVGYFNRGPCARGDP
jgi:hypothetical protein